MTGALARRRRSGRKPSMLMMRAREILGAGAAATDRSRRASRTTRWAGLRVDMVSQDRARTCAGGREVVTFLLQHRDDSRVWTICYMRPRHRPATLRVPFRPRTRSDFWEEHHARRW